MLAYVLALVVGLGSFALYMAAFFFPEVHRKSDFIWSGVGLFYALVLWVCAGRITGGVLLGQTASVALLGWLGWQTLSLRRAVASPEQQTPVPSQGELSETLKSIPGAGGVQNFFKNRLGKSQPQAKTSSPGVTVIDARTPQAAPVLERDEVATTPIPETTEAEPAETSESSELKRPNPPAPELIEAAQKPDSPDVDKMHEEVESVAGIASAPPAEPPGVGDPEDRKADIEEPVIEAIPINPENPSTLS